MTTKTPKIKTPGSILQLHIELHGTEPKIWRRVLVPDTISLKQLHSVIQRTFGWENSHMHEFVASDGKRCGSSSPAMHEGMTLKYIYDFGDHWEHRIEVEKVVASDPQIALPRCIAGANAAPPDDSGGVPGYYAFVKAMADPSAPEHDDMVDWIGRESWDATAFDAEEINARLAKIRL